MSEPNGTMFFMLVNPLKGTGVNWLHIRALWRSWMLWMCVCTLSTTSNNGSDALGNWNVSITWNVNLTSNHTLSSLILTEAQPRWHLIFKHH